MIIKNENPPNLEKIKEILEIRDAKMIFCWGDVIYNPHKLSIADHLIIHEQKHSDQQGNNPQEWWNKYLEDKDFRLSQELEAYREQYKFAKKWIKDRNTLARFLWQISGDLTKFYKLDIIQSEAMKQIKQ